MYQYQIQTQLGVCKKESAYFVVWTEKDIHIEVICFNAFLWSEILEKSKVIFDNAILPELVGKFMTRMHRVKCLETTQVYPRDHSYL